MTAKPNQADRLIALDQCDTDQDVAYYWRQEATIARALIATQAAEIERLRKNPPVTVASLYGYEAGLAEAKAEIERLRGALELAEPAIEDALEAEQIDEADGCPALPGFTNCGGGVCDRVGCMVLKLHTVRAALSEPEARG